MMEIVIGRDYEDLERFSTKGTIKIGKHLVGSGEEFNLTTPVLMDVLRPHVILICGKRGTGKSYTMGVFIEEIMKLPEDVRSRLSVLVIDTQGIFWTMKSPAEYTQLLSEWKIEPMGFPVKIYVPVGEREKFSEAGVNFDGVFSILPSQLTYSDWLFVFDLDMNSSVAILLHRVLSKLSGDFDLDDMISRIREIEGFENEKMILENLLRGAKYWGIFGERKIPEILEPGKVTILDVSLTPQHVRTLLVSLVARNVFEERIKARRLEELSIIEGEEIRTKPMCWIFIDEAHNFLPTHKKVASFDALMRIIREGRQPGISLVLATQQPNKIHVDAISQCDIVISHRLTSKEDIESLESIMQTYILFNIAKYIEELPRIRGVAIILDDNSERLYKVKMRPRQSWHAGESPLAIYRV